MCHSLSEMEYRLELIEKKLGVESAKKIAEARTGGAKTDELACPTGQKD
jgi:hypothetical protein